MVTPTVAAPAVMARNLMPVNGESLARLEGIAREAGARILEHYHAGVLVEQKGDRGPVTAADRAAHASILAALTAWDAGVPVISEEGDIPPMPSGGSGRASGWWTRSMARRSSSTGTASSR